MTTTEADVQELPALATKKQTAQWAGCSERHIDNISAAGKFPAPVRLGSHPRWRRSDLLQWLNGDWTPSQEQDA